MFVGRACPGTLSTCPGSLWLLLCPDIGLHLPSATVFHEDSSPLVLRLHRKAGRKEMADRESEDLDSGCNTHLSTLAFLQNFGQHLSIHVSFLPLRNRVTVTPLSFFLGTPGPKSVLGPTAIILVSEEEMEAQRFDTAAQGQTDTRVQSWDRAWVLS